MVNFMSFKLMAYIGDQLEKHDMKINTVDLHEQLNKIRTKHPSEQIIEDVNELLNSEEARDQEILQKIENGDEDVDFDESRLDPSRIYTMEQIKKLCISYRLRFLDTKYFKGQIPYEAISETKAIEKQLGRPVNRFKIIAPKELFNLSDKDSDPILMLPLKNDRFYFIHKWGGEISRFRSILAFPMRNMMTMFWVLFGLALLFSIVVPTPSTSMFIFLVVHSFIGICGMACLIIMSMRENFSNAEWNSQYLS